MSMKKCKDFCDRFSDYLDGETAPEECRLIQEHLSVCSPCSIIYKSLQTTVEVSKQAISDEIPEEVQERLKNLLRHAAETNDETPHERSRSMAESEHLVHVTDGDFENEILKADLPVLVDFWAAWCGPCRTVGPIVEELATEYAGKVKVAKLDVDGNKETPSKYGVRGIPTLMLFKGGQVVDQIVGAVPKNRIKELLDKA
jgi:thioredoxin 1